MMLHANLTMNCAGKVLVIACLLVCISSPSKANAQNPPGPKTPAPKVGNPPRNPQQKPSPRRVTQSSGDRRAVDQGASDQVQVEGFTITVIGKDRMPVPNATISISNAKAIQDQTTKQNGMAVFGRAILSKSKDHKIKVTTQEYGLREFVLINELSNAGYPNSKNPAIILNLGSIPPDNRVTITITVVGEKDSPLPNADVAFEGENGPLKKNTDQRGVCKFENLPLDPEKEYKLKVQAKGYNNSEEELSAEDAKDGRLDHTVELSLIGSTTWYQDFFALSVPLWILILVLMLVIATGVVLWRKNYRLWFHNKNEGLNPAAYEEIKLMFVTNTNLIKDDIKNIELKIQALGIGKGLDGKGKTSGETDQTSATSSSADDTQSAKDSQPAPPPQDGRPGTEDRFDQESRSGSIQEKLKGQYMMLVNKVKVKPEPTYLSIEDKISPFEQLQDNSVSFKKVDNTQGAFVLLKENANATDGWIYPNPILHFRPEILRLVFPSITSEQFDRRQEEIEPAHVITDGEGRWKVAHFTSKL